MCPELTQDIEFSKKNPLKFVRANEVIVFGSFYDFHINIAREHFKNLPEHNGKPIVDDAGTIETNTISGKPKFTDDSTSCHLKGGFKEARKKTIQMAQSILGEENVEV